MTDSGAIPNDGHASEDLAAYRNLPPGWYRDPENHELARFWDGTVLGEERRHVAGTRTQPASPQRSFDSAPQGPLLQNGSRSSDNGTAPPTSTADELEHLAQLRDRGILTETEFQAQKAHILQVALLTGPIPGQVTRDALLTNPFLEPVSVMEPVQTIDQIRQVTPPRPPKVADTCAQKANHGGDQLRGDLKALPSPSVHTTANRLLVWSLAATGTVVFVICVVGAVAVGQRTPASSTAPPPNAEYAWLIFGMVVGACLLIAAPIYAARSNLDATPGTTHAPAGWYPDPSDPQAIRYWRGASWSTETASRPTRRERRDAERAARAYAAARTRIISRSAYYLNHSGNDEGTLTLTSEGIQWRSLSYSFKCPWTALRSMFLATGSRSRLTVTRAAALGVFALGAKKTTIQTEVTIQDGQGIKHVFILPDQTELTISNRFASGVNELHEINAISEEEYALARRLMLRV